MAIVPIEEDSGDGVIVWLNCCDGLAGVTGGLGACTSGGVGGSSGWSFSSKACLNPEPSGLWPAVVD